MTRPAGPPTRRPADPPAILGRDDRSGRPSAKPPGTLRAGRSVLRLRSGERGRTPDRQPTGSGRRDGPPRPVRPASRARGAHGRPERRHPGDAPGLSRELDRSLDADAPARRRPAAHHRDPRVHAATRPPHPVRPAGRPPRLAGRGRRRPGDDRGRDPLRRDRDRDRPRNLRRGAARPSGVRSLVGGASMFRRFLGLGRPAADPRLPVGDTAAPVVDSPAETATARRIVAKLEALPPAEARYLACFAYVMSRAANAENDISPEETAVMERFAVQYGGLDTAQAVLVIQMAKIQARVNGGTEDFVVT